MTKRDDSKRSGRGLASGGSSAQPALFDLATKQHGVVCRRQMTRCGLTVAEIRSRVASKALIRLYPGTYAVGHRALTVRSRWMAAVLYAGDGAVLSHRAAAALFGLVDGAPTIEVTRTGDSLARPGLTIHHTRNLGQEDQASVDGIPVTSPSRTLIDLAGIESPRSLDDRLSAARRLKLLDCGAVRTGLDRVPNSKGAGELKRLIRLFERSSKPTRSELETRFLRLCADAGVPLPEADVRIGRYFADLLWREHRLIAEIDSRGFHLHRFEEDRIRDIATLSKGYRTIRVTDRMLKTDPGGLVDSVRTLLSSPSSR